MTACSSEQLPNVPFTTCSANCIEQAVVQDMKFADKLHDKVLASEAEQVLTEVKADLENAGALYAGYIRKITSNKIDSISIMMEMTALPHSSECRDLRDSILTYAQKIKEQSAKRE